MSDLFQSLKPDPPRLALPTDPEKRCFIKVAVERGLDRVRGHGGAPDPESTGELTYEAPPGVLVGQHVLVPLGRGNAPTEGIVVSVGGIESAAEIPLDRIKPILRATSAQLPQRLIDLARWMAEYYICPLGMVLASLMPAAVKQGVGRRTITLLDRPPESDEQQLLAAGGVTGTAHRVLVAIHDLGRHTLPLQARDLADRIGERTLAAINRLTRAGFLREVVRETVHGQGGAALEGLSILAQGTVPEPTAAQRTVLEGIAADLGRFRVHLIRGVTGSGKTEVYLRLVGLTLARSQSAIVLVPEISLTPQAAARFTQRFGVENVVVLHSRLSASQRNRQWRLASGAGPKVIIGARSALFAPVESTGLIIVDEEHSTDYKQDQLPRYHARDVAIKLGSMSDAPVVLGTATPSLETWLNAVARPPKFVLWELNERVGGGILPEVRIVDLADERRIRALSRANDPGAARIHGLDDAIGPTLESALNDCLAAGGQALLLQNRRGYASRIACPSAQCGWSLQCEQCDASMVFHRRLSLMAEADRWSGPWHQAHAGQHSGGHVCCHHCLAEQVVPAQCPVCGRRIVHLGAGTQRIEDELERRFTHHGLAQGRTLLRVDGDTMRIAADYADVLTRFASGEVRVLVGTQIISKGLDFPNVRLVGVIDADTSLNLPDFRAAERTFQLVSQVVGRAGRAGGGAAGGGARGLAIVQTHHATQPALRHAQAHDFRSFADDELRIRKLAGLPPWQRMARVVVRDENEKNAITHAETLKSLLLETASAAGDAGRLRLLGPLPCPVSRIASFHRIAIEMLSPTRAVLQRTLAGVRQRGMLKSDAHTAIDVDPISLM